MDKDITLFSVFIGAVLAILIIGSAMALPGCSLARVADRLDILRECGYPSNSIEAVTFQKCIEGISDDRSIPSD